ncbi:MAG: S26 family signal peptidase [Planctomycetota bacterium]|nr:S26 family signal peptidase [Planctomycetota bacterium]
MTARTSTPRLIRDAIVVAAIAVLTVQVLRRYVGDRYLVPSDSMQPLLYGDPVDGDVVFVDKTARAADLARGDLVVVESPQRPGHQLVKRIAASGDEPLCWVDILKGDLWLGENAQQMRREVKEPRAARGRSVTWAEAGRPGSSEARLDLRAASAAEIGWVLAPMGATLDAARAELATPKHAARHRRGAMTALPRGTIGTSRPVDASFIDMRGACDVSGEDVMVADCGVALAFAGRPEALLLSIDSTDFATTFVWIAEQDVLQVWVDGKEVAEQRGALGAGWGGEATFGRLDGRDFVMLGAEHCYALKTPGAGVHPRPKTWLHVGAVGGRAATLTKMRVFRDVYAYRDPVTSVGEDRPWPKFVRPGHWFLLGDNAFDSRDSRQFGDVPQDSCRGAPKWVIGPWERVRTLKR